jgi:hypothetical protein
MPDKTLHRIHRVLNYLEAGRWMHLHGYSLRSPDSNRYELFTRAAREFLDEHVLYLEFGVADGRTMRFWSGLLTNPRTKLHGFDSFEGLPTAWNLGGGLKAGAFSTGGRIPEIADPRVRVFRGWFSDTLRHYEWPAHDRLVVNVDADLYPSAVTVLDAVESHLQPGSVLYFDEFHHPADELRAFDEFLDRTGMKFELVGATPQLAGVMFRRL